MMATYRDVMDAVSFAMAIIESYQLDIEARPDLMSEGFCQGEVYREAIHSIRSMADILPCIGACALCDDGRKA